MSLAASRHVAGAFGAAATLVCPDPVTEPPEESRCCAIICAAGSGERFGDPRGKQFVPLRGLPLAAWSLLAFDRAPSVGHIVVACAGERLALMNEEVIKPLSLGSEVSLVRGGATRQESVTRALRAVPQGYELVAVHDAARPLIDVATIEACIAAVRDYPAVDGAICANRVTDTLKLVEDETVVATADRSFYWSAQTPQVFRLPALRAAHALAAREGYEGTDDASLVEHRGGLVICVESPRDNIKVTVPEDLAIAEALLERRLAEEAGFTGPGSAGGAEEGAPA